MKKLFNFLLNLLPEFNNRDKVLHFLIGLIMAIGVYVLTGNAYLALAGTIVIAIFKEAWDYNNYGYLDQENLVDLMVTISGGLLVFLMVI
jgi:hypothetical protein